MFCEDLVYLAKRMQECPGKPDIPAVRWQNIQS